MCVRAFSILIHIIFNHELFHDDGIYIQPSDDAMRTEWTTELTDMQRLRSLLSGQHPWLAVELGSLTLFTLYLGYLRLTTYAVVDGETCSFT